MKYKRFIHTNSILLEYDKELYTLEKDYVV